MNSARKEYISCKDNSKCRSKIDNYDAKCISANCSETIITILKLELENFKNGKIPYEKKYEYQPHKVLMAKSMIDMYNLKIKDITKIIKK